MRWRTALTAKTANGNYRQVTAYARVHDTATSGEYLAALKRCEPRGAADSGELRVGGKVRVHTEESRRAQWKAQGAAGVRRRGGTLEESFMNAARVAAHEAPVSSDYRSVHTCCEAGWRRVRCRHSCGQALLPDKAERLELVTALAGALDEKLWRLDSLDHMKPTTHLIGRRYRRHALAASQHRHVV